MPGFSEKVHDDKGDYNIMRCIGIIGAMEVEVKEDAAEYTFIRTYKPIDDRIGDIAYIQWGDGYAFIVNNTNCKSVRFTSGNEVYEEVIPDDNVFGSTVYCIIGFATSCGSFV